MNTVDSPRTIQQPVIFIAGVRKCGTTTLFDALACHSAIATPRIKEPQLFGQSAETVAANLAWYEQLFSAGSDKVWLDGSTLCFGSHVAADAIRRHVPESKVILVIRDPAKRAYSAYLHMHKETPCADTRSFPEILDALESDSVRRSLAEAEEIALDRAIARGQINRNYFSSDYFARKLRAPYPCTLPDPLFIFKYFQESSYHDHIHADWDKFGKNLKIIVFESLVTNPQSALADVLDFLGLSAEDGVVDVQHKNQTLLPKNRLAAHILRAKRSSRPLRRVVSGLKQAGFDTIGRQWKKRLLCKSAPQMSKADYQRARRLLAPEYEYWFSRYSSLPELWSY